MEINGIKIDSLFLKKFIEKFDKKIKNLENDIYKISKKNLYWHHLNNW